MTDRKDIDFWGISEDEEEAQEAPEVELREPDGLGWDLLFDFHAMIAELEQTPGIVEVKSAVHPPVPIFTIETIEHGLGIRVPEHIRSFYMVCDGLEFSWSYEDDEEVLPGGGAHLFDFATVFDSWLDSLWVVGGDLDEETQDFLWTLRGFDRTYQSDWFQAHDDLKEPVDEQMVVMCVEEEYPSYDLFMHDLSTGDSRLLNASFRDYFDCMLASRGIYGWQRLLFDEAEQQGDFEELLARSERFFPAEALARWRI